MSGDHGTRSHKSGPGLKHPCYRASGLVILGQTASGWSVLTFAGRRASAHHRGDHKEETVNWRETLTLTRPIALIVVGAAVLLTSWTGATFRWYEALWPMEAAIPGAVGSDPPPAELRWTELGLRSAARMCDLRKTATGWVGRAALVEDGNATIQLSQDLFLIAVPDGAPPQIRYGALLRFSGRFASDLVGCPAELSSIQEEHTRVLLGRRDDQPVRVFLFQFDDVRLAE
jgi:hypothetical protein